MINTSLIVSDYSIDALETLNDLNNNDIPFDFPLTKLYFILAQLWLSINRQLEKVYFENATIAKLQYILKETQTKTRYAI